jgi:hypothetical protein
MAQAGADQPELRLLRVVHAELRRLDPELRQRRAPRKRRQRGHQQQPPGHLHPHRRTLSLP